MNTRPVLVTGATGNVGAPLVRQLVARGVPTRAGVRDPTRWPGPPEAEPLGFDFSEPASFGPALAGCRGLFLLRPPAIADVRATLVPCIDAAIAAGVERIVFLSVVGAESMRVIPHAKVEAHLEARRAEIPSTTLLRAGFFAQNLADSYRPDIVADDRIAVAAGRGKASFIDTRDIAEIAALALEPATALDDPRFHNRALVLTGPEALDFTSVAALLSDALGRRIRYEPLSLFGHVGLLRRRGLTRGQAIVVALLHFGLRFGQGERLDPTSADLLGRPPTTLAQWITEHRALFESLNSR